jgi:hypothetical protein
MSMAIRGLLVVVGLCGACSGQVRDEATELGTDPPGTPAEAAEDTSFPINTEMASRLGSDNAACFGVEEPIAFSPDEMGYEGCESTRGLRLGEVRFADADGDGKIERGEALRLIVELSAAPEHTLYPGVFARVTSDHVAPTTNGEFLYAILAAFPEEKLWLDFQVSLDANPGETLEFAVCASDSPGRRAPCREVDELDFALTVE